MCQFLIFIFSFLVKERNFKVNQEPELTEVAHMSKFPFQAKISFPTF